MPAKKKKADKPKPFDRCKAYLGDGAYVQRSPVPGDIVLTTENGISTTNRIVLGLFEWKLLKEWVEININDK